MNKIKKGSQGFTLLELLVVVVIIGLLTAISIPQYKKVVLRANLSKGISFVEILYQAQQSYYLAHNTFANNLTDLDISLPQGCTEKLQSTEYTYVCSFGRFYSSGFDSIYFIVSDQSIAYVKHLLDHYVSTAKPKVTLKANKRYCFAKPKKPIAREVCKDIGGVYLAKYSNVWEYYELE